jgi:asparagine synthase (glutamine-hydrolysing)
MCGIAGFLARPGHRADPGILARMTATLHHRGPDAIGHHVDGRVALGVTRLRIVDLETGDQPMASEDGTVHAVLNGEIYNYQALREQLGPGHRWRTRSDTEVIVHLWEEQRDACVDVFNGMFALAVWDARREQLFLARDRMGEKPLYYTVSAEAIVFASELRALLAHPGVTRALDRASVARYLAYDCVPDPHTMIRGVWRVPPGHTASFRDGALTVQPYWDIPFAPDAALDEASACEEIRQRLDAAVRLRLMGDVPVGSFLSGGIDSTAITATAARLRPGLRTFSVGYADSPHDERPFARIAAQQLGTVHEELVVTAEDVRQMLPNLGGLLDEPIADMSFVPLHLLARAARPRVTVALTGDGGDELFAGYPAMAAAWWHDRFARLPASMRRLLAAGSSAIRVPEGFRTFVDTLDSGREGRHQSLIGGLPGSAGLAILSPALRDTLATFEPYREQEAMLQSAGVEDATSWLIYRDCKLYLAGQNLANADRASMAASLELRAPFLDHTFVEFMGRVPSALKLQGLLSLKRLLKRALADRLPADILRRGKQGFGVPIGTWFRGPLAGVLTETLARERIDRGGVFDGRVIERAVHEHIDGVRDHRRLLWAVLVFELWREHHLAGAPA